MKKTNQKELVKDFLKKQNDVMFDLDKQEKKRCYRINERIVVWKTSGTLIL